MTSESIQYTQKMIKEITLTEEARIGFWNFMLVLGKRKKKHTDPYYRKAA